MEEDKSLSRREFLSVATWSIVGVLTAGMAIPAIIYVVSPTFKTEEDTTWIAIGSTSKIEPGVPTLFKAKIKRQTGWVTNETEISFYVLTEDNRDYLVMSNICTHLGCRVRWIDERQEFFCPCHNGVFDKVGNVVSGPPPRPLERFVVKVENGQLYIQGG